MRRHEILAALILPLSLLASPVVAQDRPSPLGTRVLGGGDETPTLRDWFDFGHGPGPGDRAPDVRLDEEDEGSPRLFEALDPRLHTLLLFDGATASEAGYRGFVELAGRLETRWPGLVATRIVVPHAQRPAALAQWSGEVLLDAAGAVHERYGARSECIYLVRPDGYVGYRSQPAEPDKLCAYLERIFV